jgi:hypothetical protein
MTSIAILKNAHASYSDAHISFWRLDDYAFYIWPRPKFFFDIGLRVNITGVGFSLVQIALPFEVEKKNISDLASLCLSEKESQLIFGKQVDIDKVYETISFQSVHGPISDKVISLDVAGTIIRRVGQHASLVDLKFLTSDLAVGTNAYFRVRIACDDPSPIWTSKSWAFAKMGFVFDLRVNDVREVISVSDIAADALAEIERVFLFIILTDHYTPKHFSPELYYSRLLEPGVWRRYISFSRHTPPTEKLAIHQWRSFGSSATKSVNADNPFRVYLDVSKEFGVQILIMYVLGGLISGTIILLLKEFAPLEKWVAAIKTLL